MPAPSRSAGRPRAAGRRRRPTPKVSDELERWLNGDGRKTVGGLIELFEEKCFALLFVLLLGVPALPLPTGGVTHVFEILAVLLALQLIVGRQADLGAAPLARAGARRPAPAEVPRQG